MLREIALERIQAVNAYVREDVEHFRDEWLRCRRKDQERNIRDGQKRLKQAKKRLDDLDRLIQRIYEDQVLGNLSMERYKKMSAGYEAEQEQLRMEIANLEGWVNQQQEMNVNLDSFIALVNKYVDVTELNQTIVNEYIRKIIVYAPDKSSGHRVQKVEIVWNFLEEVGIPSLPTILNIQKTLKAQKTA